MLVPLIFVNSLFIIIDAIIGFIVYWKQLNQFFWITSAIHSSFDPWGWRIIQFLILSITSFIPGPFFTPNVFNSFPYRSSLQGTVTFTIGGSLHNSLISFSFIYWRRFWHPFNTFSSLPGSLIIITTALILSMSGHNSRLEKSKFPRMIWSDEENLGTSCIEAWRKGRNSCSRCTIQHTLSITLFFS